MNCDESVVIMSAVRYMCGRGSYGVGCVCDHIRLNKHRFSQSNKEVIERDILEAIRDYPDMPYKQDWLDLIDYIKL
jgi:hypothetical protein